MIITEALSTTMVSFSCEVCNDTIVKKKLDQHKQRCRGAYFSCIDCSTTFTGSDYRNHTLCISEAEKYEKALYKGKKNKASAKETPQPSKKAKAESKPAKKNELDLAQFSSGPLYKVVKALSKNAKLDKKDVLKKLQVKRVNGELTLTM